MPTFARSLESSPEVVLDALWLLVHREQWLPKQPLASGILPQLVRPKESRKIDPIQGLQGFSPDTPPQAKPISEERQNLSLQDTDSTKGPTEQQRASPISIDSPLPLPNRQDLARALRPLTRRVRQGASTELDVDRTIDLTANARGQLQIATRSPLRRLAALDIVIDTSRSMDLWRGLDSDLLQLFEKLGAFRRVNLHYLGGETSCARLLDRGGAPRSIAFDDGARLVLLFSDTIGPLWRSGAAFRWIASIGHRALVTVAHLFPPELQDRTVLMHHAVARARAVAPFCPNRDLEWIGTIPGARHLLPPVPVIAFGEKGLRKLATLATAAGGHEVLAIALNLKTLVQPVPSRTPPVSTTGSSVEAIRAFYRTVSAEARNVAEALAVVPLMPEVMRFVQQSFFPTSSHWHLAEVVFSGIVSRVDDPDVSKTIPVYYDFHPGVREILLSRGAVDRQVEILDCIGDYLLRHYGFEGRFNASLADPAGKLVLPVRIQRVFARVKALIYRSLGRVTELDAPIGPLSVQRAELLRVLRKLPTDLVRLLHIRSAMPLAAAPRATHPEPLSEQPPVRLPLDRVWDDIASHLRSEVTLDIFDRWFKDTELVELSPEDLTLRVPNDIYRYWIEDNYLVPLRTAVLLTLKGAREVRFVSAGAPPPRAALEPSRFLGTESEEPQDRSLASGFNPNNTFDTFVVGMHNEFAAAACRAVSENPGKVYNPLFFYGGVGLGKTHLMHAIGQHLMATRNVKVAYVTSEKFANEFIDAIQTNTLIKFRKRYRQVDVLLVDDIQFLANKARSQEEIFHTFNSLFDRHAQLVLTSDRPPTEISNLEPRLVSRFEWGLTAELQTPDVETRVAILRKKASTLGVKLAPEAIRFIAESIRTNVRRLEGALMRVALLASLGGPPPSMERIQLLLKDLLAEEARRSINVEQIQMRVAEHFDVRLADMTSKRRPKNIAFPRQIAMYLARELTKMSLVEIGEAFGGRDHGTVLQAYRLVRERMSDDDKVRQTIKFISDQLHR